MRFSLSLSLSLSLSCLVCALIAYAAPSASALALASASGTDELLRIPISRRVLSAPAPIPVNSNLDGTSNAYATDTSYTYTSRTLRKVFRSPTNTNTSLSNFNENDGLSSFAASDREGINNYYTLVYTARIDIGSPPQPFDVVFDTGSADLWVFDRSQISNRQSYIHYFDPSASSTVLVTSYHFEIRYGKGFAVGIQARDKCTLLGLTTNAWFGLVSSFDKLFETSAEPMDGILGFAMKESSQGQHPTLIDELQSAGLIKRRVFSFLLDPTAGGSSSLFILGGADQTFAPAGFESVTVTDYGQRAGKWVIPMQHTSVGGAMPFSCSSASPCVALVDTGTSVLNVPPPMLASLWSQISSARSDCKLKGYKNNGDWSEAEIWCSDFTYDHMPLITLRLGGSSFLVYPSDYVIVNGGLLMIGIGAMNVGDLGGCGASCYQFILGDVFLKMHYSVFDMDLGVISIAKDYDRPRPSAPKRPGNAQTISPHFWYYLLAIVGGLVLLFIIFLLCRRCHMRRLEVSMHSQGEYHASGREALLQHQHQQTELPLSQRAGGYRLGGPSASASASAPSSSSGSSASQYRPSPYAYAPGPPRPMPMPMPMPAAVAPPSASGFGSGSGSGSGASWWNRSQPAASPNPTQSEGQY